MIGEEIMIRFVEKFTWDTKKYRALPPEAFNCIDTETDMLMERDILDNEIYYLYHNGEDADRYKRVVALSFVDVCTTDGTDDLSKYGFKLIGFNRWIRT